MAEVGDFSRAETLVILAEVVEGRPAQEEVLVERLEPNRFRLLQSPGLVSGLAAGDEFSVDAGHFNEPRVLRRSGNRAVQIFKAEGIDACERCLVPRIAEVHGWLDGKAQKSLVFTVPGSTDVSELESLIDDALRHFPDAEWCFGN